MSYLTAIWGVLLMTITGVASAAGLAIQEAEKAAFHDCVLVLQERAHVDNKSEMSALGFGEASADEEGLWASKSFDGGEIRIGVESGKPGCRMRFSGNGAEAVYEAVLKSALGRGFAFADGARKPSEAQFVMDTLVHEKGPIGIVSMFRMNSPDASMFAMTLFPPLQ